MRNRGCGLLHLPGIENVEFPNFHRLVDLLEFELRVLLLVKGCSFFTRWLLQIHLLQTIGKIRTDRVALRCRCHSLQTTTPPLPTAGGAPRNAYEKGGVDAVRVAAFAYDTYTNHSKNNGVLRATLTFFNPAAASL